MPDVQHLPSRPAMPDPLVMDDGQRVRTPAQWQQRREEMKRILIHYFTGTVPPPPGNVRGEVLDSQELMQGKVTFRRVRLSFGPDHRLGFDVAIFIPADRGDGPFPTIVLPSMGPTPGDPIPALPATIPNSKASTTQRAAALVAAKLAIPENAAEANAFIFRRGYALATFNYEQCGEDTRDCRATGFFPAYPGYTWGEFAAWAWAMSRCVDYLETQPFVDRSQIIAVGHSRLGKTALIAGAFDERFALVAPCGSGAAGTGAFRFNGPGRGGQQGIEDYVARFSQHVGPNLAQFVGHVDRLPFDQHWLVALIAPRAFIACDGISDHVTNINALRQTYLAAKPVYDFLGVPDRIGVHYRPGRHLLAPQDWEGVLEFADSRLRHLPTTRKFDEFPAKPAVLQ